MIALEITLLADRYHATPWGRAANEGEPEWPLSPWRIGRALASAWWRSDPDARADEGDVDGLLAALTGPPRFLLPRATPGHTRHYMPRADEKTVLVLDPFVRTTGDPVLVVWDDADLDATQRQILDDLLARIGYLGRAESPCLIQVVNDVPSGGIESAPFEVADSAGDADVVRVLCLAGDASLAALSESTLERRKRRQSSAPAGRFVAYTRPRRALRPPRPRSTQRDRPPVVALRFALEGPAVPARTNAVRLAELYRAAALRRADRLPPETIVLLRGKAGDHEPLVDHHHAHYLPTDEDRDNRIDHLTVWCPAGLDPGAVAALAITTLKGGAFDHPMHLVLLETVERGKVANAPMFGRAAVWESHTPFLPVRHPKRRDGWIKDSWQDQVALELARHGHPEPAAVELIRTRQWGEFRRERRGVQRRLGLPALGVRIRFREPVSGPISLGRNSHFGMGLFMPM